MVPEDEGRGPRSGQGEDGRLEANLGVGVRDISPPVRWLLRSSSVGLDLKLGLKSLARARLGSKEWQAKPQPTNQGSTSPLDEACKSARTLDEIKKIAMTYAKIVAFDKYKQQYSMHISKT